MLKFIKADQELTHSKYGTSHNKDKVVEKIIDKIENVVKCSKGHKMEETDKDWKCTCCKEE